MLTYFLLLKKMINAKMRLTTLVKREYKSLFVVLQSIEPSGIMG